MYYLTFIKWGWLKQRLGIMTGKKEPAAVPPPPPFPLRPIPSPLSSASLYPFLPPNLRRKFGMFPMADEPLVCIPCTLLIWRQITNGSLSLPCYHWWKYFTTCKYIYPFMSTSKDPWITNHEHVSFNMLDMFVITHIMWSNCGISKHSVLLSFILSQLLY